MARISAEEANQRLLAAIDAFSERAYGSDTDSTLAEERAGAIDRYLGKNIDPAPVGRSQVRDRTVFEVVEWTKPSLLRIFTAGNEICRFDPVGPEDENQAEQESDYINYVITQRNNWFKVCNDLISDGLLLKNGYLHAYWDESTQIESEFYENLTDDAFALVAGDPEIDVVAHDQRPNEEANKRAEQAYAQARMQWMQMAQQAAMQAQMQQPGAPQQPPQLPPEPQPPKPAFLHDVEIKRTRKRGQVKLCTLAPERCLIDMATSDSTLDQCNYFEFYDWKTIGQLRAEGFDVPDDISDTASDNERDATVERARDQYDEDTNLASEFADRSMRSVRTRYIWIRHDYDGDGINELQYVVLVGTNVLARRQCEEIPVSSFCPIPLAHRHIGMSLADSVIDIEDVNTNLIRQTIDNLNLANTPRIAVSDRVNMADMLDVRVGGVIRVDGQPPQEFMPVTTPSVFADAVAAVSFFDSRRQNRTGINAYFQGTDSNALNKTASGISQLTNSAAQRVETIARYLANCVERAFLVVHRLILQHGHSEEVIKLRNKWVTIDPAMWRKRTDVRIAVGLGTGNKDSVIAQLNNLFQMQMAVVPLNLAAPPNIYNTVLEIAKASGFSTPERFVNDPATNPPPPPQPPLPLLIEQMKSQADMQKAQMDNQLEAQKTQAQLAADAQLEQQRIAFDKWKTEFEAQVRMEIERMKLGATGEMEMRKLASTENSESMKMAREDAKAASDQKQSELVSEMVEQFNELQQAMQAVIQTLGNNKVVGVERIRDPKTGRMVGGRVRRADGSSEDITIQ